MSSSLPPDVARFRAALASLGDDQRWPEVDATQVFLAAHNRLTITERRAVVDELVRNPRAIVAWQLARELDPDRPAAEVAHRPSPNWRWLPIAAVLAIVGGLSWQFQPWRPEVPVYRSTDPRAIAALVPPNESLARHDATLRWTSIDGARYRVRVLSLAFDGLDESGELTVPEYRVPEEALKWIPDGGRVLWQVEARVPGSTAFVSPTFSVRIE